MAHIHSKKSPKVFNNINQDGSWGRSWYCACWLAHWKAITSTCAFPAITSQNVCHGKHLFVKKKTVNTYSINQECMAEMWKKIKADLNSI